MTGSEHPRDAAPRQAVKLVVTGGTGKLGRWVLDALSRPTDDDVAYDITALARTSPEVADDAGVTWVTGDIEDLGHVQRAFKGADAVLHLAGVSSNGLAPDDETFRVNVMGAFNVFEAAHRLGIPRVVSMSSDAVFGWAPSAHNTRTLPGYLPLDENHPTEPLDTYGLSKLVGETIARSYAGRSDRVTVVLRAPWILEPEEMRRLREQGGVMPEQFSLLHYVDVRDLADACRRALEQPLRGFHILQIGSGESVTAEPLNVVLPALNPQIVDRAVALDGARGSVSIARAEQTLGWRPRYFWRTVD